METNRCIPHGYHLVSSSIHYDKTSLHSLYMNLSKYFKIFEKCSINGIGEDRDIPCAPRHHLGRTFLHFVGVFCVKGELN